MSADVLLSRLVGVRRAGTGHRADCSNPQCLSKGAVSVATTDDGRILLHCFSCGDVPGILAAVGLGIADLFPERFHDPSPDGRRAAREAFRQAGWRAALGVLGREAAVTAIAAHDLAEGRALAGADHERLLTACARIDAARVLLIDADNGRARG